MASCRRTRKQNSSQWQHHASSIVLSAGVWLLFCDQLNARSFFPFLAVFLLAALVIFPAVLSPAAFGQMQSIYSVRVAFSQLTFSQPVGIYSDNASNRLFVVEQAGVIQVFENNPNADVAQVFLDIRDRVLFGGEQGLLGLAFHPNFTENGYFYVDYVAANPARTVIARYTVNPNSTNQADAGSEQILLEIPQPFANHNGGQIAFGPDGYLYIGMGDGGSAGDPFGNGQNRSVLLGKILRIDINTQSGGRNYGVPADNPFVGNTEGFREEVFAYGFRNPWRFSFDSATGKLWAGDVGQNELEEIDLVEKDKNYGWNIMEGTDCYNPPSGCNQIGLTLPVYEYNHTLGNAVIGGYVYHGSTLPALSGAYIYGDYGSGRIWALLTDSSGAAVSNVQLVDSALTISSFGVDQTGELYLCAFDGKIYQLVDVAVPEFPVLLPVAALVALTLVVAVAVRKQRSASLEPNNP